MLRCAEASSSFREGWTCTCPLLPLIIPRTSGRAPTPSSLSASLRYSLYHFNSYCSVNAESGQHIYNLHTASDRCLFDSPVGSACNRRPFSLRLQQCLRLTNMECDEVTQLRSLSQHETQNLALTERLTSRIIHHLPHAVMSHPDH